MLDAPGTGRHRKMSATGSTNGDGTLLEKPVMNPAPGPHPAQLVLLSSPDEAKVGQHLALRSDEPLLLGRQVERDGISFDDARMSRVHARITWDGRTSSYRIGDEDSANGVYVDGQRRRSAKLGHGSTVRLGHSVFVVLEEDPMLQLTTRIERAAASDFSILLIGESGTGKELVARDLHERSGRRGAFVPINCAALPGEILAAELFGHTRSAFSGASSERTGLFRAAHGGTLFLDEIGDMAFEHQPALLRALQQRAVRPVGSEREVAVDVRVITATHCNLLQQAEAGTFRADLLARLAQVELCLPALRERPHALPSLIRALSERLGIQITVTPEAMEALASARWPGNIRDLEALLARLKLFGDSPYELDRAFLEREVPRMLRPNRAVPADEEVEEPDGAAMTRARLETAIAQHQSNVSEVARALGTSRTQVYRWLKRFGVKAALTSKVRMVTEPNVAAHSGSDAGGAPSGTTRASKPSQ